MSEGTYSSVTSVSGDVCVTSLSG